MAFDYAQFSKIFGVDGGSYRFADASNRNTYRTGLLDASKGQISVFDADKDGSWNYDEFVKKGISDVMKNMQEEGLDFVSDKERQEFMKTISDPKQYKDNFKALDLNGDNKIDYKEMAAELATADLNDGNQDGVVSALGYHTLYNENTSADKIKNALTKNYNTMNLENLGEAGDIKETTATTQNPVSETKAPEQKTADNKETNNNDKLEQLKKMLPMLAMIMMLFAMFSGALNGQSKNA